MLSVRRKVQVGRIGPDREIINCLRRQVDDGELRCAELTDEGIAPVWREYDFAVFPMTIHPDVSGRAQAVLMHERLIDYFLSKPGVRFCTFAEIVANATVRNSPVDQTRRPQGLDYIRNAGSIDQVMAMNYEDGTWPGENAVGYAVGYLLCDLMLDRNRQGFADWIKAVKAGKDWREAMAAQYGASAEKVAAYAANWYRTND